MPIYEFFCESCNTIFNFFSKKIDIRKVPACPRCKGGLKKQVSLFASINKSKKEDSMGDIPIDEKTIEKAMNKLASEAENLKDENPRHAAELMRKFSEMTGVKLGNGMQEALNRIGSGEDPEKIEAEMGDILESEDPFLTPGTKEAKHKTGKKAPLRDETLYDL